MYPLTTYCGYGGVHYFCLSPALLALYMDGFLLLLYVCFTGEPFHFIILFRVVAQKGPNKYHLVFKEMRKHLMMSTAFKLLYRFSVAAIKILTG